MKITILGAGAMGALFGGYLSRGNEVYLVDVDAARVGEIKKNGVRIREKDGSETLCRPNAVTNAAGLPEMDLVVVFVKAMYTAEALQSNRELIGKDTYLMTLQNGLGHEGKLMQFTDAQHVIIGSTQHNSSIIGNGYVNHGGSGKTLIGLVNGDSTCLSHIAKTFTECGFECGTSSDVKRQAWTKLFTNTAASSLTAVLQVPLGFISGDDNARKLLEALAREATAVANADCGGGFDEATVIEGVLTVCRNASNGYTSICADVRNGNRTEVDMISGSVVAKANEYGIPVPYHEMVVALIHAMENKMRQHIN